jgi:hypothetical protein
MSQYLVNLDLERNSQNTTSRYQATALSTFCEVCFKLFAKGSVDQYASEGPWFKLFVEDIERDLVWRTLHDSRQILERGLASGCELCHLVTPMLPPTPSDFRSLFCMSRSKVFEYHMLAIVDSTDSDRVPDIWKALWLEIESVVNISSFEPTRSATLTASKSGNIGSGQTLHLASLWLAECESHHKQCIRMSEPRWYPTRLLKISESGHRVRLITTAEERMHGPYFTLSHCWGTQKPRLMLTSETDGALRNGLAISELEHTYRDALVATSSLGAEYLWIDLFCIGQGESHESKQD